MRHGRCGAGIDCHGKMAERQVNGQQLPPGHTVVLLRAGQGTAKISKSLLASLPFLGKHCPDTYITGVSVHNEVGQRPRRKQCPTRMAGPAQSDGDVV